MKNNKSSLLLIAAMVSSAHAMNVDFTGSGSAGVLSSCLVDLDSKVDGVLASEAPYTMMSSTQSGGSTGNASITAVNLPSGTSVTFTKPTLVDWNADYNQGNDATAVRVSPRGSATCDTSDFSETMVTCSLPSALGISLNEVFDVDTRIIDSGGFSGQASDYTLRTVVTCVSS